MKKTLRHNLASWAAGIFIILLSGCGNSTDTPPDTLAPTIPANVQALATSPNEITLSWEAAGDDVGVAQYEIYVGGVPIVSLPSTTTMFLYSGLNPSTEYCCTVRAIDAAGNESALSDPPACAVTVSVPDTTPPAAPTGLTDTSSQTKIALSWVASADAAGYKVYRDGVFIGAVPTASFVDVGLNASTLYCYTVTAIDAAGNESAQSDPACITTLAPPLDTSIPTVISTFPLSNATDVQIDPFVATATFSEAMNMTVTEFGMFTLTNAAGLVSSATVSYNAVTDTVSFTPSKPLAPGEVYTATISKAVQDVVGNRMGIDYIWSFTTTTTPAVTLPTVTSTAPTNGELNVAVNIVMQAVFSEPVDINTILAPSNFSCFDTTQIPPVSVSGLVTYNEAQQTAFFMPSADLVNQTNLNPGTIYECRISKNVTDLSGHGMAANFAWHFVTAP